MGIRKTRRRRISKKRKTRTRKTRTRKTRTRKTRTRTRKTRTRKTRTKTYKKGGSSATESIPPEMTAIIASAMAVAVKEATRNILSIYSGNTSETFGIGNSSVTVKNTPQKRTMSTPIVEIEPVIKQFANKSIPREDMLQYNIDNDEMRIKRIKQFNGTKIVGENYTFKGVYEKENIDPSKLEIIQQAADFSRVKINRKIESCEKQDCLHKIDVIGGITVARSLINDVFHYFVIDGNHGAQVAIQLGKGIIGPVVVIGDITIDKKIDIETDSGKEDIIDIVEDLQNKLHEESQAPGKIEIPTKKSVIKLQEDHKASIELLKEKSMMKNKAPKYAIHQNIEEMESRLNKYLEEDDPFRKTFIT